MNVSDITILIEGYGNEIINNKLIIIPFEIYDIIYKYYFIIEWETDWKYASKTIKIKNNNIIYPTDSTYKSIFLTNHINNGIYKYTFKIIHTTSSDWDIRIGIYKLKCGIPNVETSFGSRIKKSKYCYINHMVIDLIDNQLSYIVNGKDYGIAFNIENTKYKIGVICMDIGQIIQFIGVQKLA